MRRMMIPALLLTGVALAQEPTLRLAPSPLELPANIGPLVGNPSPHRYDQPGMGVSYQYSAPGASLTVYVYDAGVADLGDGAETVPVCQEFEFAKQGVAQAYPQTRLLSQHLVKLLPPAEKPLMREAVFEFAREGRPLLSYVWITTVAHQFIKLRFTVDKQLQDELPDARRAILAAVGTAIEPHLAPVAADAAKPGSSINISMEMMDGDLGAAALLYPLLLSAMAEKEPGLHPVCGGELVPPYETELGIYRSLFVDGEKGGESRVGQQIRSASANGFLEELVWVELHRESWGDEPPEGLTLRDYAKWKKKNLKRFRRPALGSVVLDYPRALPLESESAAPNP